MKIASSSATFHHSLSAGDLTQLEWLDLCGASSALDGIVFDARHFPRTDDDYLAQLKKMSVDLGLTIAGLAGDAVFMDDGLHWIDIALQLGAPLIIARTPHAVNAFTAWNAFVATVKRTAAQAKRANIIIALRNAPGTICEEAADLKRLAKETDSSWIRYALDPMKLSPVEPLEPVLQRTVVTLHDLDTSNTTPRTTPDSVLLALTTARGFIVIDDADGQATSQSLERAISEFREANHTRRLQAR